MADRDYIIDRLTSRSMTKEEFDFEKLSAPSIRDLFLPGDLEQLHYYATSLKLSGRPDIKFKEIDRIMTSRGFKQFINGTNRTVYRFLEDRTFLARVAFKEAACEESMLEYRNQFFLKPFVPKIFEITPDGVLQIIERVVPIRSAEEYASVADDIYVMLSEWFLGSGFVFDDIGSEDFMNTGIRKGFGPVILDYPYIYPVDKNKIFCSKPDPTSPTGCCEGEIDYDAGFNQLYCTKCGAKYRARELSQAIKDNNIIIKRKENVNMKFTVSGGKLSQKKQVTTNNEIERREVKSTPKGKNIKKPNKVEVTFGIPYSKKEELENRQKAAVEKSEEKKQEKKKVESPFAIDEKLKGEKKDPGYQDRKDHHKKEPFFLTRLEYLIEELEEDYGKSSDDDKKRFNALLLSLINVWVSMQKNVKLKDIQSLITNLQNLLGVYEEENEDSYKYLDLSGFSYTFTKNLIQKLISNGDLGVFIDPVDEPNIYQPVIAATLSSGERLFDIAKCNTMEIVNTQPEVDEEVTVTNNEPEVTNPYNDIMEFAGEIINVKDIFPSRRPKKVIAIKGEDGEYITVGDNDLMVLDMIDDRSLNKLTLVSKSWYDEITSEDVHEVKEEPVGVSAPKVAVNGIDGE